MKNFLTTGAWDKWLLTEAQIVGANTWSADGHVNRAYFDGNGDAAEAPEAEFSAWADIRPVAFSLIKGKRTPVSFRFILMPPESASDGGDKCVRRVCRIRFAEGHVYIASAVSMDTFSLDKEPEREWDKELSRFLSDNAINFEEL